MDPYCNLADRCLRRNDYSAGETGTTWHEVRSHRGVIRRTCLRNNVTSTCHEKVKAPTEHADPDRNIK